MKSLKEHAGGIVLCLFELIVGVLLLINPAGFTTWIIIIAGIALVITGIIDVIKYFRTGAAEAWVGQDLAKGLISLLAGGFCILKSEWFLVTFPMLAILYGVVILLNGIGKIQLTVDLLRQKRKGWFWAALNAVIAIVCGIVVIGNPFTSTVVLWVFTGISLIVEGVIDIITMITQKRAFGGSNR